MDAITRQLEHVQRRSRRLLILQRVAQFLAVAAAVVLALAVVDYALRFPGWLRLILWAAGVAVAVGWVSTRVSRAVRFRPAIEQLALRAERLFPQYAGKLASAVEFTLHPEQYRDPETTARLSRASVQGLGPKLGELELGRLIDPTRTWRALAGVGVAVAVIGLASVTMPEAAKIAAARTLAPWSAAEWPLRQQVVDAEQPQVWAIDAPLRLEAEVQQGYSAGMRVWVNYRVHEPGGDVGRWESVLMSEQAGTLESQNGRFERLIDLPEHLRGAGTADDRGQIEYTIEAGDHETESRQVQLVSRPRVRSVSAQVNAPEYASGLVSDQSVRLDRQSGQVATVTGLRGSAVELAIAFNKPIPRQALELDQVLPGLSEDVELIVGSEGSAGELAEQVRVRFTLDETTESTVHLSDRYGLSNNPDRTYRVAAEADELPSVTLVEPRSDEAVLASAMVELAGLGQDDVGMEWVSVNAVMPRNALGEDAAVIGSDAEGYDVVEIGRQSGRQPNLTARQVLDLADYELAAGDRVQVFARGQDVFELNGERHEVVESSRRELRIIDEPSLVGELRGNLTSVRQHAQRQRERQQELSDREPAEAESQQQRLSEDIRRQQNQVEAISDRMERNRLDEPALEQMVQEADRLLDEAGEASEQAAEAMEQALEAEEAGDAEAAAEHAEQAQEHQGQAEQALAELEHLLDQGRDALTLQLELRQQLGEQQRLEQEVRELLPQTLGMDREDLPEEIQDLLDELARQQGEAGEELEDLIRDMQTTAEALRQSEDETDQVTAEMLDEAAAIAEREAAAEQMEEAAEQIDENQLSQAGQSQEASTAALEQMLEQMEEHDELMLALLQRQLEELAQTIERLIEQQQAKRDRVADAAELEDLEPRQSEIRRNTLHTADQAAAEPSTEAAALALFDAADAQGQAILSLRDQSREMTDQAQAEALEHLEDALDLIQQAQEQMAADEMAEQREQLQQAYEALAEQQEALRDQTEPLSGLEELDRQQRAELVGLGNEQDALGQEAAELHEQVAESMMFDHAHRRIDRLAERTSERMQGGQATRRTVADQDQIARTLRALAQALDPSGDGSDFAHEPQPEEEDGMGMDGEAALVPDIAEVRALREVQQIIYEQTRWLDENDQVLEQVDREQWLDELAEQQGELRELGERLIEQMQQMMGGPGGQEPAPQDPEIP